MYDWKYKEKSDFQVLHIAIVIIPIRMFQLYNFNIFIQCIKDPK